MKEKIQKGMVRAYLAYKRAISNIKGSPTMEYIDHHCSGSCLCDVVVQHFLG